MRDGRLSKKSRGFCASKVPLALGQVPKSVGVCARKAYSRRPVPQKLGGKRCLHPNTEGGGLTIYKIT